MLLNPELRAEDVDTVEQGAVQAEALGYIEAMDLCFPSRMFWFCTRETPLFVVGCSVTPLSSPVEPIDSPRFGNFSFAMAGPEPYKHGYYLWKYVPSVAAAAIFCLAFAIATAGHVWRIWKTRAWMAIPFAIGGFSELHQILTPCPFFILHIRSDLC
jgi:hypothetical protein